MNFWTGILCLIISLSACTSKQESVAATRIYSSDKSDITAPDLVTAATAYQWLNQSPQQYLPVQVSNEKVFLEEHLPYASNIWRPQYASDATEPYGGLSADRPKVEALLQSLGYQNGKTLLLYDAKANVDALRFAWVLRLYGFEDYKIINGGLQYWKLLGLPTTRGPASTVQKSEYQLDVGYDSAIIASYDDVLAAIKDTNTILIDTREPFEYEGLPYVYQGAVLPYKKGAFQRGRIPTAVHLNWSKLADLNGDHRIKSEKDLRYDLDSIGISPNKKIVLYCQTGSRTSHTFYVLNRILGYDNVRNYDGSWVEWSYKHSQDSLVPVVHCDEELFSETFQALLTKQDSK